MGSVALRQSRPTVRGDTEEAGRLFEKHSDRIFAFCLRRLGSRSDAEDAVQTTFLYALRALRRGVVPECESAWLTTIAKNVCHWQRRTRDRRGPLASDIDLDTIGLAQPDGDEDDLLVGLKDALASIPENQRRAIVLREWQGVPPREIATELGMTATATHALLTRARRSLAEALMLPRRAALGAVWTLVELRSHVKALLAGVSTKAAVATVAVVGVGAGVGGVAIDKTTGSDPLPRSPVLVNAEAPVGARFARGETRVVPVASVSEAGLEGRQSSQRRSAPPASTTVQSTPPARSRLLLASAFARRTRSRVPTVRNRSPSRWQPFRSFRYHPRSFRPTLSRFPSSRL